MVVLALAGITAVMRPLCARLQRDLKRCSPIPRSEHRIISSDSGSRSPFKAYGMGKAAALASPPASCTCSPFAVQEPASSSAPAPVLNATGERDMGAARRSHPSHAADPFVFLAGCTAISALPPLNAFVSNG